MGISQMQTSNLHQLLPLSWVTQLGRTLALKCVIFLGQQPSTKKEFTAHTGL